MKTIKMSMRDVINFGGDPYTKKNVLVSMSMLSGITNTYGVEVVHGFKTLFGNLPMDEGEDNRIPDIASQDIFESLPWDFEFAWQDLMNVLTYKIEHGIMFLEAICPICRQGILEDAIIKLDEYYAYFCTECNNIMMMYGDRGITNTLSLNEGKNENGEKERINKRRRY